MSKSTYIYDTSKGFSAFLKHHFSDKMNIDVCTNKKKFLLYDLKNYNVCFFIVNDMDDFFNLMQIYNKIDCFFIGSPNKIISQKIENLNYDSMVYLDFSSNKNDILSSISFNLMLKELL
jgi:hypothetical protein